MHVVVALHGDGGSGDTLRRDIGDPNWIDLYPDWKSPSWSLEKNIKVLSDQLIDLKTNLVLIGYSSGGSVIARLTEKAEVRRAILCAVVYESPVLSGNAPPGNFPVLMIWNKKGRLSRAIYSSAAIESMECWCENHPVRLLIGQGRHAKLLPPQHMWDQQLNSKIESWIKEKVEGRK